MLTALISDIHANRYALEAVLEHAAAQGAQSYAFLGDLLGYGADPGWVLDRVAAFAAEGAVAVLGNHDEAVLKGNASAMHDDAREAIAWQRAQLTNGQLEFLARLPLTERRGDCLYVHASADSPASWHYVMGRSEAIRSLHATDARYTFCGHMHQPMLYHLSGTGKAGEFTPQPGVPMPLPSHRQWLVIPGACGQPRDGNPAAAYALFDDQAEQLVFQRVPYDIEAAAAAIRAAKLPPRLADRLFEGY